MQVLIPLHNDAAVTTQLQFVADHNWTADTEFVVMAVVKPIALMDYGFGCPHELLERIYKASRSGSRQIVKHSVKLLRQRLPRHRVRGLMTEGAYVDEVLAQCVSQHADLLVLGKQESGLHKIAREQRNIAAAAPCSVIFVEPEAERYYRQILPA